MAAFTNLLRLVKQAFGENTDTWGLVLNEQMIEMIEDAVANTATIILASSNYTLSTANGTDDEARKAAINLTGALGANVAVVVPSTSKLYVVTNNTTGAYGVTVRTSGGTGPVIPAGHLNLIYCDGTNCYDVATQQSWVQQSDIPSQTGNTTFTVPGDKTATYTNGKRLKLQSSTGTTQYATVTSSVFGAVTTITVVNDTTVLPATLNRVSVGIGDANKNIHARQVMAETNSDVEAVLATKLPTTGGDMTGGIGMVSMADYSLATMVAGVFAPGITGNNVRATGASGTITSIDATTKSPLFVTMVSAGAVWTEGANLILQGVNITAGAGDEFCFFKQADGKWKMKYHNVGSSGGSGITTASLVVTTAYKDTAVAQTTSATIPLDNTAPQDSEGTEFIFQSITPKYAASTFEIDVYVSIVNTSNDNIAIFSLFADYIGTSSISTTVAYTFLDSGFAGDVPLKTPISFKARVANTDTSAKRFSVRFGKNGSGSIFINQAGTASMGNKLFSSITIRELI